MKTEKVIILGVSYPIDSDKIIYLDRYEDYFLVDDPNIITMRWWEYWLADDCITDVDWYHYFDEDYAQSFWIYYCSECDEYREYCDCWSDDYESIDWVESYWYRPKPVFYWDKDHIGIELEYNECSEVDVITILDNFWWLFYAKEDSSLDNWVEFVSHPFSYDYYIDNNDLFYQFERYLRKWYATNWKDTWLHIHLWRNDINDITLARIWKFINRKDNQKFIEKIAGRSENNRCNYKKVKANDTFINDEKRYSALNLNNNKTIEFRIFISTITPSFYFGRFEFIRCLLDYVRKYKRTNFLSFIRYAYKSKYQNLKRLLDKKNIYPLTKIS